MRQSTLICQNFATQDPLVRALRLESWLSELCYEGCVSGLGDTGPVFQNCTVQDLLVVICDEGCVFSQTLQQRTNCRYTY